MGINLSKSKFNREMVSLSKMECIAEKSTCQKMPMHQINKCGGLKTPLKAQLLQRNEQIYGARSTQHVIATFERLIRCRCKFDSQGANNLRQKLQRFNQLRIFLWTKLGNNSSICDFNIDPFDEYSLKSKITNLLQDIDENSLFTLHSRLQLPPAYTNLGHGHQDHREFLAAGRDWGSKMGSKYR